MHIDRAKKILKLPPEFDALTVNKARKKAIAKIESKHSGSARAKKVKRVKHATDYCVDWLRGVTPPANAANAILIPPQKKPAHSPRAPRHTRYTGHDLRHKKRGNLWAGFHVPKKTCLPPGWKRAGKNARRHPGQPYTSQSGDPRELFRALVDFLGGVPTQPSDSIVSDAPLRGGADDFRSKGGVLWAGQRVSKGTPLPPNWKRAGNHIKGHPGQPWTTLSGDAKALRAGLLAYLNAA
jgi:hypothetical protein